MIPGGGGPPRSLWSAASSEGILVTVEAAAENELVALRVTNPGWDGSNPSYVTAYKPW